MKSNSTEILAALENEEVGFFFLVQLHLSSIYHLTTLSYPLTWDGQLYDPEDKLLSFESPRATTVVDRQTYKLRLSGLDPEMKAEVESGIINKPVKILMGFIVNGVAQTGLSQVMSVYSGHVANVKKVISDGEQAFAVECSAPLSSLDAKSTLFTTKDGMDAFDETDTSFDQIFEGSSEYELNWGKSGEAAPAATRTVFVHVPLFSPIPIPMQEEIDDEIHGR